jgi:hypothetical protein
MGTRTALVVTGLAAVQYIGEWRTIGGARSGPHADWAIVRWVETGIDILIACVNDH